MRVKAVRKLPGYAKARVTQQEVDILELQVGTYIDDALAAELDRLLRGFWSAETYGRRPHSYKQAAAMLHVSTKYLQRRVSAREIPFTRVGAYVRFTGNDIDEIRLFMRRTNPNLSRTEFPRVQQFAPIPRDSDNEYDNSEEKRQPRKPGTPELN